MSDSTPNPRSSSTTFIWKKVMVRRPPEAHTTQRGAAAPVGSGRKWRGRSRTNPRDKVTVTLYLRGGPEAWVAVRARGEENYYPGYTQIIDILIDVTQSR